jgi:hypothetical protein
MVLYKMCVARLLYYEINDVVAIVQSIGAGLTPTLTKDMDTLFALMCKICWVCDAKKCPSATFVSFFHVTQV